MGTNQTPMMQDQQFASDNYAGMCPEALEALSRVNAGHVQPYGDDPWTAEVCDLFREIFNCHCQVFFVFNGTAANSLALSSYCQPYHSVICHQMAHIETDECGAPEFFSHGAKILLGEGANGKLEPQSIDEMVHRRTDIHFPKPKVVSVTQATELGTVYTKTELQNIQFAAKKNGLKIHMDGARFANAVASLGVQPRELTVDCGVDVLCLGGSKNGLAVGDAVIFFNPDHAQEFAYRCKQAGQLASKMRFIAAQWLGVLKDGIWLKYAAHANRSAMLLEDQLKQIPDIEILCPRQVNSVFVSMPQTVHDALHSKGWHFYTFIGHGGARLMCSWNTTEKTIHSLVSDIKAALA